MGSLPRRTSIQVETADPAAVREQHLLRRVQAGEKKLFYELVSLTRVASTAPRLLCCAMKPTPKTQPGGDSQGLHAHQSSFAAEARFSTWLIQIAVNEALMRRRRAHSEIMEPIGERQEEDGNYTPRDFADWREIPSEALERKEIRQKLAEAVAMLTQKYREGLLLRDRRPAVEH